MERPQKITLGEMRAMGIRGLLIYCSDYKCSHNVAISADQWPDDVRLSDLEPLFSCTACGLKGAEVRGNFDWEREQRCSVTDARRVKPGYQGSTGVSHEVQKK
jgi:hypothetical protein